jgi:hypothetical protein
MIFWIFSIFILLRLRADKSQKDSRFSQTKLYQSSSLTAKSPSTTLTKPIQYTSYYNYGNNTLDQNLRTHVINSI